MKCYYHPALDAVATCSQCSKAACHECIWDTGGAMTCTSCYNLAVANYNKVAGKARMKIVWSVLFTVIGALMIAGIVSSNGDSWMAGFLIGLYCAFSLFWGVPPMWGWWFGFFRKMGCILFLNPLGWVFFFYFPVIFGFTYGFMGGAIYQFFKNLKAAMSTAQLIQ